MKTPSSRRERHGKISSLTIRYLEELTLEDIKSLGAFADHRLGSLPRSQLSAEDVVQKTLLAILLGTTHSQVGRRPKFRHLQTKATFLHYVRSAINSVIEAFGRSQELRHKHKPIQTETDWEESHASPVLTSTVEADADAQMVDLKRELFRRLRKNASRELLPVIDEWERTFFWAIHVPCRRKREYVRRVRKLAMGILKELAEDLRR